MRFLFLAVVLRVLSLPGWFDWTLWPLVFFAIACCASSLPLGSLRSHYFAGGVFWLFAFLCNCLLDLFVARVLRISFWLFVVKMLTFVFFLFFCRFLLVPLPRFPWIFCRSAVRFTISEAFARYSFTAHSFFAIVCGFFMFFWLMLWRHCFSFFWRFFTFLKTWTRCLR